MFILEGYRSSIEYREILRILQKATSDQENMLWQSHVVGRSIVPILHLEIDFVNREVVLNFDTKRFILDPQLPLYIKLGYRSTVFKVVNYRQGQHSIHFAFPEEIKTEELRSRPRHEFPPNIEKVISLRPSVTKMTKDTGNEMRAKIIDVSIYGMGLLISEPNRAYFKNNRILWITSMQDILLESPILAEVMYISNEIPPKYISRKTKNLKVGIQLANQIPDDIYQGFIK